MSKSNCPPGPTRSTKCMTERMTDGCISASGGTKITPNTKTTNGENGSVNETMYGRPRNGTVLLTFPTCCSGSQVGLRAREPTQKMKRKGYKEKVSNYR